jgi:hypothetical protein
MSLKLTSLHFEFVNRMDGSMMTSSENLTC